MIIDSIKSFFRGLSEKRISEPPLSNSQQIQKAFEGLEIVLSDVVELEFKDPREFGISGANSTTFTRLNEGEFETPEARTVKGIVTRIWHEPLPLNEWLIEVTTHVKTAKGHMIERKLLLMASEIEWIRKVV